MLKWLWFPYCDGSPCNMNERKFVFYWSKVPSQRYFGKKKTFHQLVWYLNQPYSLLRQSVWLVAHELLITGTWALELIQIWQEKTQGSLSKKNTKLTYIYHCIHQNGIVEHSKLSNLLVKGANLWYIEVKYLQNEITWNKHSVNLYVS